MFGQGGGRGSGGGDGRGRGGSGSGRGRGQGRWDRGHGDQGEDERQRGVTRHGIQRHAHKHRMSRVEQGEQTREEILDIAMEMFAEQGYSGTSMRMIANACGTSQSLLHFHFGSKMDLYHSVLDRMQERYKGALEAPLSEESSTEEFLLEGLLERLRFYQRYPNRARIALWSALEETYEESRDMTRMRRDVADRLEQAKDQGLIQENVNVPLLAGMLVGVVGLWPLIRERYTEMLPRSERKDADEAYNRLVLEILSRGAGTEALQKALNNRDSD